VAHILRDPRKEGTMDDIMLIEQLSERVKELEERVRELETELAKIKADPSIGKLVVDEWPETPDY
jgi:hypothetical protein